MKQAPFVAGALMLILFAIYIYAIVRIVRAIVRR
jgi:hypothetical protein